MTSFSSAIQCILLLLVLLVVVVLLLLEELLQCSCQLKGLKGLLSGALSALPPSAYYTHPINILDMS